MNLKKNSDIRMKGVLDMILTKVKDLLSMTPFQTRVDNEIQREYISGMEKTENLLKPTINVVPQRQDLNFLKDYVNKNIQAHADEVGNQLRQEIERGILNGDNQAQLADRVRQVFKDKKYSARMKTVLRTEKLRANNQGIQQAAEQAEQAGVKVEKWLDVVMDNVTTDTCREEHKQHGTPDQSIPINDDFVFTWENKTYRAKAPPFHPNCRTVLRLKRIE